MNISVDRVTLFRRLRSSLELLAASSDAQRKHIIRLGTAPSVDELALEFGDAWPAARPMVDAAVQDACDRLYSLLRSFSGDEFEDLWSVSGLDRTEWVQVRKRATECLVLFNRSHGIE